MNADTPSSESPRKKRVLVALDAAEDAERAQEKATIDAGTSRFGRPLKAKA